MRIAVYTSQDGSLQPFWNCSQFLVYEKTGGWQVAGVIPFEAPVIETLGVPERVRSFVRNLIARLESCPVIAGMSLTGIPYALFDQAGKQIFEIPDLSGEQLDGIADDLNSDRKKAATDTAFIVSQKPVETQDKGSWYLDLVRLQKEYPEISSKKAMTEFLSTDFEKLTLVCQHVPPWIEYDGRFDIVCDSTSGGDITAVIRRKQHAKL